MRIFGIREGKRPRLSGEKFLVKESEKGGANQQEGRISAVHDNHFND